MQRKYFYSTVLLLFSIFNSLSSQITFSEIMYNPATSESHDEYIEIYNLSDSIIDLSNFYLADSFSVDNLQDYGDGMLLGPYQYALILDGSYLNNSATYDTLIPTSAIKLTIDNNTFTSGGLSNSSEKTISIYDSSGILFDSYRYSLGNIEGYSDEKIIVDAGSDASNWKDAHVLGGTPGGKNSVSPLNNDLDISLSVSASENLIINTAVEFRIMIANKGLDAFYEDLKIQVYIDFDNDRAYSAEDVSLFEEISLTSIDSGSMVEFYFNYSFSKAGKYSIIAEITDSLDENLLNNQISSSVTLIDTSDHIHINEIKFLTIKGEPEWLEIYNSGPDSVYLLNWAIADVVDTVLIDSLLIIAPGGYKVIAEDAGLDSIYEINTAAVYILNDLPALNNSGDVISLINPLGRTLEQVPYNVEWLEDEVERSPSLERINIKQNAQLADNWGPSTSDKNATPAKENSILPPEHDLSVSFEIIGNEIAFTHKTLDFLLTIYNQGQQTFSRDLHIQIYIDSNRDMELSNNDAVLFEQSSYTYIDTGSTADFSFDFIFQQAGNYSIVAQVTDSLDENVLNNKISVDIAVLDNSGDIYINEIKFLTIKDEPEWLELFNAGPDSISLQNWSIADMVDTVFIDSLLIIAPGEYKAFAKDSGLDTLYNIEITAIHIVKNMPSFNNSEDVISLLNPLGEIIDRVPYSLNWLEGDEWRSPSLERINIQLNSAVARNWGPSAANRNATPAAQNSLFTSVTDKLKSRISISPNPFSPDNDGIEDFALINLDLPVRTARIKVVIYDVLGRKIRILKDNSFSGPNSIITWNGKNDAGRLMRMGIYIVYVQILNDHNGIIKEIKDTVVLARSLR